jgi:hypothetical protein
MTKAALFALLMPVSALAWDGPACSSATEYLRIASRDAEAAGKGLAGSPSSVALAKVRSALIEAADYLERAREACGVREKMPSAKNSKADSDKALADIEAWTARMEKNDPRYKSVEDVLLRHVEFVIRGMPAEYWLPTLQLMYGAAADAAKGSPRPSALPRL